MANVKQLVLDIKEENADHEWYPSSPSMLKVIKSDMANTYFSWKDFSILDVGAGNGSAIEALVPDPDDGFGKKGTVTKFAIEKAQQLINAMPEDIFICGTDFHQQTLMDKPVDVLFCNPPYSEFEIWISTIIRDACAKVMYFIIPTRWKRSKLINDAVSEKGLTLEVLDTQTFVNGPRQARCEVDILKCAANATADFSGITESFKEWFDKEFDIKVEAPELGQKAKSLLDDVTKEEKSTSMVESKDIVSMLVDFYQRDMNNLFDTYRGLEKVDAKILGTLNVSLTKIREALALQVKGLKVAYWREAINSVDKITHRFTSKTRKAICERVIEHSKVDFTSANIHAVLIWMIKNVNKHTEEQITSTMEKMFERANVTAYKSNQKTFGEAKWRYNEIPSGLKCFKLDLRVVIEGHGFRTISNGKLDDSTTHLLDDLCAIALSVGFDTMNQPRSKDFFWEYGKPNRFTFKNLTTGKTETLFEAKRFKNGNIHVKFAQRFICALNIAHGKIKGWVQSAEEAAEEMDIPLDVASRFYRQNLALTSKPLDMFSLPNKKEAA